MFFDATSFNQDLNAWDTGKVQPMNYLFRKATSFNQDLNAWDTGNVQTMPSMFSDATSFNQDLNAWDTGKVEDMSFMFKQATPFNQDLNAWDTGKVSNMYTMFRDTSFNQDLDAWDTGNMRSMSYMFAGASSFNQDLNAWDTGNVLYMNFMFSHATSFNQDLNAWDTGNVLYMNSMFVGASSFDQNLSAWDTAKVISMYRMFVNTGMSCPNKLANHHHFGANAGIDLSGCQSQRRLTEESPTSVVEVDLYHRSDYPDAHAVEVRLGAGNVLTVLVNDTEVYRGDGYHFPVGTEQDLYVCSDDCPSVRIHNLEYTAGDAPPPASRASEAPSAVAASLLGLILASGASGLYYQRRSRTTPPVVPTPSAVPTLPAVPDLFSSSAEAFLSVE